VTDSTLDSLTEKAPYPFCHPKPWSPFSLRRFDEAPFSRRIKSENEIQGVPAALTEYRLPCHRPEHRSPLSGRAAFNVYPGLKHLG
jgi:hypothetical protein